MGLFQSIHGHRLLTTRDRANDPLTDMWRISIVDSGNAFVSSLGYLPRTLRRTPQFTRRPPMAMRFTPRRDYGLLDCSHVPPRTDAALGVVVGCAASHSARAFVLYAERLSTMRVDLATRRLRCDDAIEDTQKLHAGVSRGSHAFELAGRDVHCGTEREHPVPFRSYSKSWRLARPGEQPSRDWRLSPRVARRAPRYLRR